MEGSTAQFLGILVAITGLLGWLIKQVISYFISMSKEERAYIETLVSKNQENIDSFVNTINHQRTLDREMQGKNYKAIEGLTKEITISNQVNEKLLKLLSGK